MQEYPAEMLEHGFALGLPDSVSRGALGFGFHQRDWLLAGFAQDDWRIANTPNLESGIAL